MDNLQLKAKSKNNTLILQHKDVSSQFTEQNFDLKMNQNDFKLVCTNLLENAIDYSSQNSRIVIVLQTNEAKVKGLATFKISIHN